MKHFPLRFSSLIAFFVFFCACLIIYRKQHQGVFLNTLHLNIEASDPDSNSSLIWMPGQKSQSPKAPTGLWYNNKQFQSYSFITFNYYLVQIHLMDTQFATQVRISLTSFKNSDEHVIEAWAIGSLLQSASLLDSTFDFQTQNLSFKVSREHNTTHYISRFEFSSNNNIKQVSSTNLTHILPRKGCLTLSRPNDLTQTCTTGDAQGFVTIKDRVENQTYGFVQYNTDSWMFGFGVGSSSVTAAKVVGNDFYWVKALGTGWNFNIQLGARNPVPIKRVGLSFGHNGNANQNFLMIEDRAIKLEQVTYKIDQQKKWKILKFYSEQPFGEFEFKLTGRHQEELDWLVFRKSSDVGFGIWSGQVTLPDDLVLELGLESRIFKFEKVFGTVGIHKYHV